jgi:hypothetical protein
MKLILSFIPLIVMITIVPSILASCLKLSARLLRRRVVSWKDSFIFAFMMMIVSALVRAILLFGSLAMPFVLGIILAFVVQVTFGAWFFSHRATYADGQKLGWRGGAELTAFAFVFIIAIGSILMISIQYLLMAIAGINSGMAD